MGMDRSDLGWLRPDRCDANGFPDAGRRHASRMDQAVPDYAVFVAAVGAGNAAHHAPGVDVSADAVEGGVDVGHPPCRLCCRWVHRGGVDHFAEPYVQPFRELVSAGSLREVMAI